MKLLILLSFISLCYSARRDLDWLSKLLINCNHDRNLNLDVSKIRVYFYDFSQNSQNEVNFAVNSASSNILSLPYFDKKKKIFMFVGGFKSAIHKDTEERVRQTFKKFPNSYLIIIDHSPYTNNDSGDSRKSYARSVNHVYYIGKKLGQMLVELHRGGVSPQNIHCIGHSLGSQILGHVGYTFMKNTHQKIWRITALDPAGPCFMKNSKEEQVRSGVAEYVEIYHCNSGKLGTSSILGDVDFFVNKGDSQPGCEAPTIPSPTEIRKSVQCDHKTCVVMWLASVENMNRYPAYKCDKYEHFKSDRCLFNDRTTAGFWNPGTAKGVYYFSTSGFITLKDEDIN